jgi:hypothetical protein
MAKVKKRKALSKATIGGRKFNSRRPTGKAPAAKKRNRRPQGSPMRKAVPAGATRQAFDRALDAGGGGPGSGAGPRHAAGDVGSDIESFGPADTPPFEGEDVLEQGPPYAGISGGAVGGSPAQVRSSGGRVHRGISPGGAHRGDSTIGTDPKSGGE